jgi:8-oxo-dGTP pyrophosphatase MutT (NUDIX family)
MANKVRTVGCFLEWNGKFLILLRRPEKHQGNKWDIPAGKVRSNETDEQAILREVEEETGYRASEAELKLIRNHIFYFSGLTVEFPTFRIKLQQPIQIKHSPAEHQDYKWVTAQECYAMPDLHAGFHDLLEKIGYIETGLS